MGWSKWSLDAFLQRTTRANSYSVFCVQFWNIFRWARHRLTWSSRTWISFSRSWINDGLKISSKRPDREEKRSVVFIHVTTKGVYERRPGYSCFDHKKFMYHCAVMGANECSWMAESMDRRRRECSCQGNDAHIRGRYTETLRFRSNKDNVCSVGRQWRWNWTGFPHLTSASEDEMTEKYCSHG